MIAYTIRTDPATRDLDCSSRDPQSTIYPGKIRAIADWDRAEKQKRFPPLIEPKALARKDVKTAAEISKTLLYRGDFGATISWRKPKRQPRNHAIGRSIKRPSNAIK